MSRAAAGPRRRRKRNGERVGVTLYRAASGSRPKLGPGTSWSPDIDVALAYTDNPGFGGDALFAAEFEPRHVLDLTGGLPYDPRRYGGQYRALREALAESDAWPELEGRLDAGVGDYVHNAWENDRAVFRALAGLYSWVVFYDDFPEGAVTWTKLDDAPMAVRRVEMKRNSADLAEHFGAHAGIETALEEGEPHRRGDLEWRRLVARAKRALRSIR